MSATLANREPLVEMVRGLAQQIATLEPSQYGDAHSFLAQMETAVTGLKDHLAETVKKQVLAGGTTVTEKGTKSLELGDWCFRVIPNRTGIDPKKFEARLRTKGIDPEGYMRATITYAMDEAKLAKAVAAGVMTPPELEACRYNLTYKLAVTKVADMQNGAADE